MKIIDNTNSKTKKRIGDLEMGDTFRFVNEKHPYIKLSIDDVEHVISEIVDSNCKIKSLGYSPYVSLKSGVIDITNPNVETIKLNTTLTIENEE